MTSNERIFSLIKSIDFIRHNNVQGDFVECGVWRGGNLIIFQKLIEKYNLKKKFMLLILLRVCQNQRK